MAEWLHFSQLFFYDDKGYITHTFSPIAGTIDSNRQKGMPTQLKSQHLCNLDKTETVDLTNVNEHLGFVSF